MPCVFLLHTHSFLPRPRNFQAGDVRLEPAHGASRQEPGWLPQVTEPSRPGWKTCTPLRLERSPDTVLTEPTHQDLQVLTEEELTPNLTELLFHLL